MLTEIAKSYYEFLSHDKEKTAYIIERRGITLETIIDFQIGYDSYTKRYTIPIKDITGSIVNIRKWQDKDPKMISQGKGYGEIRVFPFKNLMNGEDLLEDGEQIIICEGEWDCILLNQNGFSAITYTGGAMSWKKEWNKLFIGLNVILILDCDQIGKDASKKIADNLYLNAASIKIIDLGLKDKEDIGDWFNTHKRTAKDLRTLIEETHRMDEYQEISLIDSLDSKFYNRKIKFTGVILGKDLSPFIIPKKIHAKCKTGSKEKKICKLCPASVGEIQREFIYEEDKDTFVKMINANDMQITGVLRQALGLPAGRNCPGSYEIEIKARQNVEEILIVPEINYENVDQEYTVRKCFFFGLGIQTNQAHQFKGTTWTNPMTQSGIHLIEEATPSKDNISKFVLTDEMKAQLKIFQCKTDFTSIQNKLDDIYNDFTFNVTHMYERQSLIQAFDLIYHSVLSFKFLGKVINKGWLECLIIGDTKCGKSETAGSMIHHYRLGEFITSSENTTFAGLVGGLQQTNRGSWHVTWGKLVMNNKGLCILDETDELAKSGTIGKLTGIRSSGIAELVKIQSQKAMAKTRLIFISNPIFGKMSEQNYGVEAVRQIFKTQQDLSRLDFAVAAQEDDVSMDVINKRHNEKYDHNYTSELCNLGVLFAWSRKVEHIIFEKDAENLILDIATSMGKEFSSSIPLVIGAEMRIKIARLAISIATRLYSTDDTGDNVVVTCGHVEAAVNFLYKVYSANNMSYKDFSEQKIREMTLGETDELENKLTTIEMLNLFLDQNRFMVGDLEDIFELDRTETREIIAFMRKNRMLKRSNQFYIKTPAFIEYLKKRKVGWKNVESKVKSHLQVDNLPDWQKEAYDD